MVFELSDLVPWTGSHLCNRNEPQEFSFAPPQERQPPVAIESFAQDPARYAELMERVEDYLLGRQNGPSGK